MRYALRNKLGTLFGHRMLNTVALASFLGSIIALLLFAVDSRQLLGVSVWEKPLKFLISAAFYAATFSWLYTYVEKARGVASKMGNTIAIMLTVELFVIVGMASVGSTSHFNVSTPLNIAVWSLMAMAISIVWVATFMLSVGLWNSRRMSPDLRIAVRWSIGLGLAGMGMAFTMTPPQPQQVLPENWIGVAGAHTVGAADGGPGLPFFGWSTEAGDLRISHFLGLHALQVLPFVAISLSLLIANYFVRRAIITGVAAGYALLIVFTYVQALFGETIVQPSTLIFLAAVFIIAVITSGMTLFWSRIEIDPKAFSPK